LDSSVGEKTRMLRSARRLSLGDMARLTGVTKSMLSQVENNLTSPSITTLRKIGAALGVPLTVFFEDEPFEGRVVRKNARKKLALPASSVLYEMLSPGSRMLEFLSVTLQENAATSEDPLAHGGEESILVLEGKVTLILGSETVLLDEGDSMVFQGTIPHKIQNREKSPATVVMAICPPLF